MNKRYCAKNKKFCSWCCGVSRQMMLRRLCQAEHSRYLSGGSDCKSSIGWRQSVDSFKDRWARWFVAVVLDRIEYTSTWQTSNAGEWHMVPRTAVQRHGTKFQLTRRVTSRYDSTRSTCRANRDERVEQCCSNNSARLYKFCRFYALTNTNPIFFCQMK